MSRSKGKKVQNTSALVHRLTEAVFHSENYGLSLKSVLKIIAEELDMPFGECRSKTPAHTEWTLQSLYAPGIEEKSHDSKPLQKVTADEFYKPGLDVLDEVWTAKISETDTQFPDHDAPMGVICLQITQNDGRNDLFRLFSNASPDKIKPIEKQLRTLLPELRRILKKKYSIHQLSHSEKRYRRLFYEDLNPNFTASSDGSITDCNRAFIDLFGFKNRKAALQSSFNDRFTNYMHQVFFWEALDRGEKVKNHEMSATTEDGENVYILLKVVARHNQNQKLDEFVGYIQDITQRKQTEVALRKSEERYRSLIETTNDWIWEIDENFCFTYSSLKIQTILGHELESVIGESIFKLMPENARARAEEQFNGFAENQKAFVNREYAFKDADGEIAIFETSGIPLFNNNGIFYGYRGIAKEITERKKTEQQIAQLNDELEHKVIERTKMLQIANKELEAFSYSVSHDLRAPLRSIDGFSQALIEDYESELDETGKNYLERVRSAAQKMSTLIDDMIKLAKVSRTSIDIRTINLSDMAQSITDDLKERYPQRSTDITIEPDLVAAGDPNLLKVVFQNLLENAWKFTSKEDTTIIEVGCKQDEGETAYFVKDNGAGFDMNYAAKLFTPFQRLHKETDYPGTGIGLSTVQRIIHRHLGKIWAEGEPGRGATFYFTLNPNRSTMAGK